MLCRGKLICQRNKGSLAAVILGIHDNIGHGSQLSRLNMEVAHGESLLWIGHQEP
jgi:hypothetical protein